MTRTENRSWIKLAVATVMLVLCVVMVPVNAKAANDVTFKCNGKSITLKWQTPTLNTGYTLNSYQIYDGTTKTYLKKGIAPTKNSCTFSKNLGYVSRWTVEYLVTNPYGSQYTWTVGSTYVNNKPAKIALKNFGIAYASPSTQKLYFAANRANNMTGTHIQLASGNNVIKGFKFSSSSDYWQYKLDKVYKYRARAYHTNYTNNNTYYGAWSGYKYFEVPTSKGTYKSTEKGLNVSVKYCAGVKNFTISVSTNKNSGYKTFATLTPTSSSKTKSVKVNKYGSNSMKKGTTYYIMITPNIKVGNSTKKSDLLFYYTYYCNR